VLDRAATASGLTATFGGGAARLEPSASGIGSAIGRLLALVVLTETDGRFGLLKECGNQACRGVFYDRSRNHSGKWCSMASCGNRSKVRAWRERKSGA
jgi:predicted RNA-binding Zn ribbon-like protein